MAAPAGGAGAGGAADVEQWHLRAPVEGNPIVFFDISIGGQPAGRLRMELWKDLVPKTAENFRQFCTGEFMRAGKPTGYKNVAFHRLIKGFMCQGGDFLNGDGTGCLSIYGSRFPDENFVARHMGPGILSMANSGRDANGCQFFITCAPCDWLDGKHVAFGRVLDDQPPHGLFLLRKMEHVATGPQNRPRIPVLITECGEM